MRPWRNLTSRIKWHKEAVAKRCSVKKIFLEISQNLQKNICARASFLIMLQASALQLYLKRLWHRCFLVNFVKFLRTPFHTKHLWWLLLDLHGKLTLSTYPPRSSLFINLMLISLFNQHIFSVCRFILAIFRFKL